METRSTLLEVINLQCVRGERSLFDSLSFQLKAGECLWLQGENGSGKTSLLRMLVGLTAPTTGTVYWNGRPIKKWGDEYRRELLYCGHSPGLKEDLSATENLIFGSALAGVQLSPSAIYDALHRAGLRGREHLPVRALSQGQKRRVNIASLSLQKRAFWLLDEPLTALDAKASRWIVELIDRHLGDGGIAVFTTHQDMSLAHATQTIRVGA